MTEPAKRILIMEDDKELSELIQLRLEASGYQVLASYRGDEGLELALREKPDLILLDVLLPGKDGYTVLKEIRTGLEFLPIQDVPVIIVTGKASLMEEMCKLEGATAFLTKPIDSRKLVELIGDYCG